MQLDPIGRLRKKPENRARVIGQITFDRPIIGLIGGTSKLRATDRLLGHPRGDERFRVVGREAKVKRLSTRGMAFVQSLPRNSGVTWDAQFNS